MPDQQTPHSVAPFGRLPDGREASLHTLSHGTGLRVSITNFGGAITSIWAPDRDGKLADVALGYDELSGYVGGKAHLGAAIGRVGNRIARGSFTLDGVTYSLAKNNGPNHLHGGPGGFDRVLWKVDASEDAAGPSLQLSLISHDGDEGYPGNLHVTLTYSLTSPDTLQIRYRAEADKPTPVNLTNHSYFNLAGHDAGEILDHEITIFASRFTPIDATLIPTGELREVAGTPLDFREPRRIGDRIDADDEQVRVAGGYDHNFVLATAPQPAPTLAARVFDPRTGRVLEALTTEPGMQFYSGNFLTGKEVGKGGAIYRRRNGLCLETQHFPDSPNQAAFPPIILRPGEVFDSTTIYRFGVR